MIVNTNTRNVNNDNESSIALKIQGQNSLNSLTTIICIAQTTHSQNNSYLYSNTMNLSRKNNAFNRKTNNHLSHSETINSCLNNLSHNEHSFAVF